jgi:hypothetical protein
MDPDRATFRERFERYERDHALLRRVTPPEEDRARLTSARWDGGFRWFRSVNVIPIEQARLLLRGGKVES